VHALGLDDAGDPLQVGVGRPRPAEEVEDRREPVPELVRLAGANRDQPIRSSGA
jgi:hypothetical protein